MILSHCVKRCQERAEELAYIVCAEAGKPIKDARGEVVRLIETFKIAEEESTRICGEVLPLDISPRTDGYRGMWQRVAIGPVACITPFNFPLNLVAHKIAPAIAAGCPFILKPAPNTPISAMILGEILAETDLPKGAFSIFPCTNDIATPLVEDDRIKLLSFTGSCDVGWSLKSRAGKKKVTLELGGNAACVVNQDWDLDDAISRIIIGGYYQTGQTCISVQRIYIHQNIYTKFKDRLVQKVQNLKMGNPHLEDTFIGPMISEREAKRVESWIKSAQANGATVVCGGGRDGLMCEPTVVENVPEDASIWCDEAFGPIVAITPFSNFDDVLSEINSSRFGLQVGIFTRDMYHAHKAWDLLDVGGVIIGDVPSFRVDHMPYGGTKDSGIGREGIRWAIEDMTQIRLLAIRNSIQ